MMRCISLWQPHASLIAMGEKLYETRSWQTSYRGLIAIHASKTQNDVKDIWQSIQHAKKTDWQYARAFTKATYQAFKAWMEHEGLTKWNFQELPYGAIVCTAELTAIYSAPFARKSLVGRRAYEFGDFAPGRFAWELKNVQVLKTPMPYRGQQGLWTLPTEIEAKLMEEAKS